jgi:hypothetical protein
VVAVVLKAELQVNQMAELAWVVALELELTLEAAVGVAI